MSPQTAHQALSSGPDWWRLLGALLLVVGLLLLTLKLLQRLQGRQAADARAALLAVHRLGARRDLELVRWQDEVYVVYRGEGSAVLLGQEPFDPARHLPSRSGAGFRWRDLLSGGRDRTGQ